jgi:hypothetical protein
MSMINHLLDAHHMDIEFFNGRFREDINLPRDSGTPLNSAVYHRNLPAVLTLLKRGADPETAITASGDGCAFPWLPAVGPLLDAGAELDRAFARAVDQLNFEAARLCLEKGANPTRVLRVQQAKAVKKAEGTFKRIDDEVAGDGGYSGDDERRGVADRREEMRELVRKASDRWMGAQSELMGFPSIC